MPAFQFAEVLAMEILILEKEMKEMFIKALNNYTPMPDNELSKLPLFPHDNDANHKRQALLQVISVMGDRAEELRKILAKELASGMRRTLDYPEYLDMDCSKCINCILKQIAFQCRDQCFVKQMNDWTPELFQFSIDYLSMKYEASSDGHGSLRDYASKYVANHCVMEMVDDFVSKLNAVYA